MRTLYETLNIAKNYHYMWGGDEEYMCYAIHEAFRAEEITKEEDDALAAFIMDDLLNGQYITLEGKLCSDLQRFPSDTEIQSYWENILKELKEQGK